MLICRSGNSVPGSTNPIGVFRRLWYMFLTDQEASDMPAPIWDM
jgi:hypothetical protein